jgi:hypothetical protein
LRPGNVAAQTRIPPVDPSDTVQKETEVHYANGIGAMLAGPFERNRDQVRYAMARMTIGEKNPKKGRRGATGSEKAVGKTVGKPTRAKPATGRAGDTNVTAGSAAPRGRGAKVAGPKATGTTAKRATVAKARSTESGQKTAGTRMRQISH